jgi:uncharacterized protein
MKIDLATLKETETSFDFLIKPSEIDFEGEGIKPLDDIRIEGTLSNGIMQTDIEGEIFAKVEVDCSRCLEAIEKDLEIPFSVGFADEENFSKLNEKELDADDLELSLLEDDEIDLNEIVREQILLAQPAQEFCREDCKGLCSECGQNQNLIDCKCKEKEVDPRWSALKNLKLNK